jgi:replicative DNA helicase
MKKDAGVKMFVRLCEGLNNKGKLIPNTDDVYKYVKDTKKDYYVSVYSYNEDQKKRFDKAGSVKGIQDVTTNKLIFDFDAVNLQDAQKDTLKTIERLTKKGIDRDSINIYYSGGKGFHLVLNTNKQFSPTQTKAMALGIARDLKSFDSVVYNANRIFRLAYTRHPVSGLYKIPLSFSELKDSSIEQIKKLAQKTYVPEKELSITLDENTFENLQVKEETKTQEDSTLLMDLNLDKRPKDLSPWKYALEQGFFPPMQRSNSLIILAATYKSLGYNETKCYYSLKSAADLQAKRFKQEKFSKDEIYTNIIQEVYTKGWNGGTYAEDNFPEQLKQYLTDLGVPRRDASNDHENCVVNISKGFGSFIKYAEMIDENTMKFGIPELDNVLRVQTGHLIGILAPPSVGKTSMALTLLNNTSRDGIKSFFGSYDMAGNILIQKLIQRQTDLDGDAIYDVFRNEDKKQIANFGKILEKHYSNVSFCFKVGQSVSELKESIKKEEEELGEEIKLVIVDYLELVRTKSSDPTVASSEAIQGLREIANEGKVVICLLQPNKLNSTVDEPLLNYTAAKGSSSIAQAVTAMITCHRPMFGKGIEDKYFSINITKNRMGPVGQQLDFSWKGITGKIGPLEDIEKQALAEYRVIKKATKEDDI